MDTPDAQEKYLDASILSALGPAANRLQTAYGEDETEVIVTKAVVCFQYVDANGSVDWGYRRVDASWFDVGGVAHLLTAAVALAWSEQNDDDD